MLRASANLLGLAWWARVESRNPDVTYWFGPFVRRSTLERELETFLSDCGEYAAVTWRKLFPRACILRSVSIWPVFLTCPGEGGTRPFTPLVGVEGEPGGVALDQRDFFLVLGELSPDLGPLRL